MERLDKRCEGFSGADMSALVREASMSALKQHLRWKPTSPIVVGKSHFNDAFHRVKPSVSGKDRQKYDAMKIQYGAEESEARKSSTPSTPNQKNSVSLSRKAQVRVSPSCASRVGVEKGGAEKKIDEICLDEDEDVVMEIQPINEGPICDSGSVERNTSVEIETDRTVPAQKVQSVLDASPKQVDSIEEPNEGASVANETVPEKIADDQVKVIEKELPTEEEHDMEIEDQVNGRLSEDDKMVSSENIETNSRVAGEKDDLNVPETEAAEDSEVNTGAESNKRLSSGLESASDISEDELKDDEASLSSEGEEEKRRSCDKEEEEVIELDTDSNDSVPFLPPPVSA